MSVSTTVIFRGISPSESLRASIEEHASRLGRFDRDVRACRIVVSAERSPPRNGDLYRVDLHVSIAGREIHVGHSHAHDPRHEDPYVAVGDAFDAARRCVEAALDRRRQEMRPSRGKSQIG